MNYSFISFDNAKEAYAEEEFIKLKVQSVATCRYKNTKLFTNA
jgi:hypothetical protein